MRVFLSYPPSANERLTVRKGGRGFVNTAKYRAWKEEAAWVVQMAVRGHGMIYGPYRLAAVAMPPALARSRDLDNLLKATCDALVTGGGVEDDSLCQSILVSWGEIEAGPGILCLVKPCRSLLSRGGGKSKLPSETGKSQTRRRSRPSAIIRDAEILASSATAQEVFRGSGRPLSSTPAESTACPECHGQGFIWRIKEKPVSLWAEAYRPNDEPPKPDPPEKEKWPCRACKGTGTK